MVSGVFAGSMKNFRNKKIRLGKSETMEREFSYGHTNRQESFWTCQVVGMIKLLAPAVNS
ncbi:hypothetical protein QQ020_12675 [Fulvivirgaceae bacterium BMA12]|uniref:Uncharacterized protein n=1 Tax=Agaribacillus aureus TaxID=3051825 RepID=A0ABT8L7E3_9BACT|nr:hypothetical protein [Fulvivirgaceae bacterium BMA12]